MVLLLWCLNRASRCKKMIEYSSEFLDSIGKHLSCKKSFESSIENTCRQSTKRNNVRLEAISKGQSYKTVKFEWDRLLKYLKRGIVFNKWHWPTLKYINDFLNTDPNQWPVSKVYICSRVHLSICYNTFKWFYGVITEAIHYKFVTEFLTTVAIQHSCIVPSQIFVV